MTDKKDDGKVEAEVDKNEESAPSPGVHKPVATSLTLGDALTPDDSVAAAPTETSSPPREQNPAHTEEEVPRAARWEGRLSVYTADGSWVSHEGCKVWRSQQFCTCITPYSYTLSSTDSQA